MTAPVVNNTGAPAVITWTLRLLVVDDPDRTVNYNGAQKTNRVDALTVNATGQPKTLTDNAAAIRLFEPLLHIGKDIRHGTSSAAQVCWATTLTPTASPTGRSSAPPAPPGAPSGGWLRAPPPQARH